MREDNLLSLRTRRFVPATTDSQHRWRVWPNLARGLVTRNLNERDAAITPLDYRAWEDEEFEEDDEEDDDQEEVVKSTNAASGR